VIERIGDFAQNQRITDALLGARTRSRDLQAQLSSGKVADRFADLAPDAVRLTAAKSGLGAAQNYIHGNELVVGRLQVMEGAVGSIFELGSKVRAMLVQRLSDGAGQPGVIEPEAALMLDQVMSALNADLDGRYLFAGSRTDTPPVALGPAFTGFGGPDDTYYQGDAVALTVRADDDLAFTCGMTADRAGFEDLVGAMRTVVEADAVDDRALLEGALDLINRALPEIAGYRAELGSRQARLEDVKAVHMDAEVYLQREVSDVEDVDLADAVTRMTQQQVLIESAMATIGRLSQLSLADFLR
jgi:flagellar hook-associated protein 3 FlgL